MQYQFCPWPTNTILLGWSWFVKKWFVIWLKWKMSWRQLIWLTINIITFLFISITFVIIIGPPFQCSRSLCLCNWLHYQQPANSNGYSWMARVCAKISWIGNGNHEKIGFCNKATHGASNMVQTTIGSLILLNKIKFVFGGYFQVFKICQG